MKFNPPYARRWLQRYKESQYWTNKIETTFPELLRAIKSGNSDQAAWITVCLCVYARKYNEAKL